MRNQPLKKVRNKQLKELDSTVVQANDLAESVYNLDLYEMRLVAFACSKINSKYDKPERITIKPVDFAKVFQLSTNDLYDSLEKTIKSLASKYVVIPNEKNPKNDRVIPWLCEGEYERGPTANSEIYITFNPKMQPYLYELGRVYTTLDFNIVARLNTPFTNRLYQWLCKERYSDEAIVKGFFERTLTVDWMRKRASIPDTYTWKNFWSRHLKPAIERINALNDIYIDYEFIKKGRNIFAVKFSCMAERAKEIKPIRPRLAKRPKVTKGSHEEGEWMRTNYKILTDYRKALKNYDKSLFLTLPDVRKLYEYCLGLGWMDKAEFYKKEIDERTPTKTIKEKQETAEEKLLRYAKELGVKVSLEKS